MNSEIVNTAVVSLVGGVGCRKQEAGRVIDSWQGVGVSGVVSSEGEVEGASWVMKSDGAADGEV